MKGKQKSTNYVDFIKSKALPITKLNRKDEFLFQQDNCTIHVSKESMKFFNEARVALLDWPPYSPDLNKIGRASCRERVST